MIDHGTRPPPSTLARGRARRIAVLAGLVMASVACAKGEPAEVPTGPSLSVTQAGPQDIGEFRRVAEGGRVPDLALLDEVGFFAEHAIDLPPADCGAVVCPHSMLAVAPRFDGGNWTMVYVALNTPVSPDDLMDRPRHVIAVVEDSAPVRRGLSVTAVNLVARELADGLGPDDRLSLVRAGARAEVAFVALRAGEVTMRASPTIEADETRADLFGGLSLGLELASREGPPGLSAAVVLVSQGRPRGVSDPAAFEALAGRFAEAQVPITHVGLGAEYVRAIPERLTDMTGGNTYFARDESDLRDALRVEARTGFVALARELEIQVSPGEHYRVGRIYGARRHAIDDGVARLSTPILQIGARMGGQDVATGRRGGGGGFFVELLSDVQVGQAEPADAQVVSVGVRYRDAQSDEAVSFEQVLQTPLGPGQNPSDNWPYLSGAGKPFMMLNMYLAMRAAVTLFDGGDCGGAVGVRPMMERSYVAWAERAPDPDIDDDWVLLQHVILAAEADCQEPVFEPTYIVLGCFFI